MEVTLRESESATTGLLRCLSVAVSACQARLRGPAVTDEDVHTVRKNLKRARAILRLAQAALTKQRFATLDAELRAIADAWSGLRDAAVQRETLLAVKVAADNPAIDADIEWLTEDAPAAASDDQRGARAARSLAILARVQRRIRAWRLTHADGSLLVDALRRSYRSARRAGRRAAKSQADEDFHYWRKLAKYLCHQLQTLGREPAPKTAALIDGLDELAELLGKNHDLCVLETALAGSASLAGLPDEGRRLLKWLRGERTELKSRAQALGSELFAARPREFAERLQKELPRN